MVNVVLDNPEQALALSYAPTGARAAVTMLFALDARLRQIALAARDPTIGLMRLTWWAEALAALDAKPPPAEPLLQALAAAVVPHGVSGAELAALVEGWDLLLSGEPDLEVFAAARGGQLFGLAARLLGAADPRVEAVGEGWGLADLAAGWPALAGRAWADAAVRLERGLKGWWPVPLRPLGALGLLARADLRGGRPGSPRRVARLLAHRLTGR